MKGKVNRQGTKQQEGDALNAISQPLKDTGTQMSQYNFLRCNVTKFFFKKLHFRQTSSSLDVPISLKEMATSLASWPWERCHLNPLLPCLVAPL